MRSQVKVWSLIKKLPNDQGVRGYCSMLVGSRFKICAMFGIIGYNFIGTKDLPCYNPVKERHSWVISPGLFMQ